MIEAIILAFGVGLVLAIASARRGRIMVLVKNGDVLIRKWGRITEEGLEVDGKVYPISKDALFYLRQGVKTYPAVIVDANANAVYAFSEKRLEREAPPELLSRLALKRILRQLTRREVQILPFISGLLVGLVILGAGASALYNQVVVPAKQAEARANAILQEYSKLKQEYDHLNRENALLLEEVQQLRQQLVQCNVTTVGNGTIVEVSPNGTVVVGNGTGG